MSLRATRRSRRVSSAGSSSSMSESSDSVAGGGYQFRWKRWGGEVGRGPSSVSHSSSSSLVGPGCVAFRSSSGTSSSLTIVVVWRRFRGVGEDVLGKEVSRGEQGNAMRRRRRMRVRAFSWECRRRSKAERGETNLPSRLRQHPSHVHVELGSTR